MKVLTEDEVRDKARDILGLWNTDEAISGTGQLTTFNKLGFDGIYDKPDGWYLPNEVGRPALVLETAKSSDSVDIKDSQILKYINIVKTKYDRVAGVTYNGYNVKCFMTNEGGNVEEKEVVFELQNKEYYLNLFPSKPIDRQKIYSLTKKINDCLHKQFGIKNLYHRMIFTACALVATRYGAHLYDGMSFSLFSQTIVDTLKRELEESKKINDKLQLLIDVYNEIKMNSTENQEAINHFIGWVKEISKSINSDEWHGEDVMAIFFNEFNRYKKKSERGQVFTPDHITSFMYRLLNVHKDDVVLDAACGSGAFLVKSMANMIEEAGGVNTKKAKEIKNNQLYGIEFDREIFALACANMLIHKDGKTNLEQMDTRTEEAGKWIKSKTTITKVLMNPPFERAYGCLQIVKNVLDNVPKHTQCAFIMPDKKLEKSGKALVASILKKHYLQKIIKLPENLFKGVKTSIFVFEAGVEENERYDEDIFACYIEDDGLETVKLQGRQDIHNRWQEKEDYWIKVIKRQSGDDTIQWINPKEHLSYQMPEPEFSITESDFRKTILDYIMFNNNINAKEFEDNLMQSMLYNCNFTINDNLINITFLDSNNTNNQTN